MVAWNDAGEGFVLQVSTPSWPGSGSSADPRGTGNTLGAIGDDDDIEVSQHFFALRLTASDLAVVLKGLVNASVVTATSQPAIVHNGGPAAVQALAATLGIRAGGAAKTAPPAPAPPGSPSCTIATLSSGVRLISKPSALHLPPWQLVSARLGGVPLRVASWWATPEIYSTEQGVSIEGWPSDLTAPGAVAIATTGNWQGKIIGLTGGEGTNYNHAKIGLSTDTSTPLCIFGDMNQQGALRSNYAHPGQKMSSSQNGRGGTFYVLENRALFESLTALLKGATAPTSAPAPADRPPRSRSKGGTSGTKAGGAGKKTRKTTKTAKTSRTKKTTKGKKTTARKTTKAAKRTKAKKTTRRSAPKTR
jgi:hypothetical protein